MNYIQPFITLPVILLFIGTLLQIFYVKKTEKKHGILRYIPMLVIFFAFIVTANNEFSQLEKEEKLNLKINTLEKRTEELLEGNYKLIDQFEGIDSKSDTILFLTRNNLSNSQGDVIIQKRAKIEHYSTIIHRFPSTNRFTLKYYFRSDLVIPLRDIKIYMIFDKPVDSVFSKIKGRAILERGTIKKLVSPTKYQFHTDYLSQSNYIEIDVRSKDSVNVEIELSP